VTATKTTTLDSVVLEEVIALCRRLRLKYVREQCPELLLTAKAQRWEPAEALRVLLEGEVEGRDRSTIEHRCPRAHFPAGKTFETWNESRSSIPTATQRAVRTLEWVTRAENLVVAGPQGTGKSHLLEALGHHGIDQRLTVAWFSVEDPGTIIRRHRVDDTVSKAFAALTAVSLTLIDDIGLLPHLRRCRRRPLPAGRRRLRTAIPGPVHQPAPLRLRPADGQNPRLRPGRSAHAPRPRDRH
jgi:DNA replication protein DnaC